MVSLLQNFPRGPTGRRQDSGTWGAPAGVWLSSDGRVPLEGIAVRVWLIGSYLVLAHPDVLLWQATLSERAGESGGEEGPGFRQTLAD